MSLTKYHKLSGAFDRVAYLPYVYPLFRAGFRLTRQFCAEVGIISRFAIQPEVLFPQLKEVLAKGRMHPMNAAAFMCVNSNKHEKSKYDTPDFLNNFLRLYSATTWQECCAIEGITRESDLDSFMHISTIGNGHGDKADKLEKIKIYCWARDLERATSPSSFIKYPRANMPITQDQFYDVLRAYNKDAADALDQQDKINKKNNSAIKADVTALPKKVYLDLLRSATKNNDISQTQCAIMLMFILHAREKRNSGGSYIDHPVAVAKLVGELGHKYLGKDEGHIWLASLAALLHDGGEKTDINLEEDLNGLIPDEAIEAIKCLHKKDDETYFEYLERCCTNKLAPVVKLCGDFNHNSSDMELATTKQEFIYPISANYVDYKLRHEDEAISVAEYVQKAKICSPEEFQEINKIAESKDKKKLAADFPHLQKALSTVKSIKEILSRDDTNANPRGKEIPSIQLRPDV